MDPFLVAIALYLAALLLAFVDIFVPSGGMLILLSIAAAVGCILFGFRSGTSMGMAMLTVVFATVPAFAYLAIKIWPHTPLGRQIILHPPTDPEKNSTLATRPDLNDLIGRTGIADGPLMPFGQIKLQVEEVGLRRFSASAESGYLESGQVVEVVAVRERALVVRPTKRAVDVFRAAGVAPQLSPLEADSPAPEDGVAATQPAGESPSGRAPIVAAAENTDESLVSNIESLRDDLLDLPAEALGLDSIDNFDDFNDSPPGNASEIRSTEHDDAPNDDSAENSTRRGN